MNRIITLIVALLIVIFTANLAFSQDDYDIQGESHQRSLSSQALEITIAAIALFIGLLIYEKGEGGVTIFRIIGAILILISGANIFFRITEGIPIVVVLLILYFLYKNKS